VGEADGAVLPVCCVTVEGAHGCLEDVTFHHLAVATNQASYQLPCLLRV
jgi:hypothetical protein